MRPMTCAVTCDLTACCLVDLTRSSGINKINITIFYPEDGDEALKVCGIRSRKTVILTLHC